MKAKFTILGLTAAVVLFVRGNPATKGKACQRWSPDGPVVGLVGGGRIRRPDMNLEWKNLKSESVSPNEKPIGEWNRAEMV